MAQATSSSGIGQSVRRRMSLCRSRLPGSRPQEAGGEQVSVVENSARQSILDCSREVGLIAGWLPA